MRRYVSIWLPQLLTDWHVRKQPALAGKAFVLKAASHNRLLVMAASPEARREGISTGMALADARALHPPLVALDDKPGLGGQLLQRMAEWCIRFTPCAAPDPPAGLLLDASGCTALWGGEEAYLQDIRQRLAARGYTASPAIADTIGTAWAVARYGRGERIVAPGNNAAALQQLPVAALRIETETAVRLNKLGLRQVGNLLELPRTALRRRFSPLLLQRLRQALGEEGESFRAVYEPEPYQERLPVFEPVSTRKGIELALERLLQALCNRLQKEGKGLRAAVFRVYHTDGGAQGIEIGTNRATQNEAHLFGLFSLKLELLKPGIDLFVLEAKTVEDCTPAQESIWRFGSKGGPELAQLLDRLSGKLGADAIHRYLPADHHWPERSFRKAATLEEQTGSDWLNSRPRPVQLLLPPEPIEVTAPVPDYPPMLFRHRGELHRIVRADGPERIEQEWWIGEGPYRDYYHVEDEAGQRYWLFRQGRYDEGRASWFLHGYFG